MRKLLCALLLVVVTGCSQLGPTLPDYQPVLFQQKKTFEEDVEFLRREFDQLTSVRAYLMKGMTIADSRCNAFFDALERIDAKSSIMRSRITALETGLPAVLSSAGAASKAVAAVAAALGYVGGWIEDYREYYLLGEFRAEVYQYWSEARALAEEEVLNLLNRSEIFREEAQRHLYKYSQLCMRPKLMAFLKSAAGGGKVSEIIKSRRALSDFKVSQ